MVSPIELDRLWNFVAEAEEASRRGTELLAELRRLLIREDTLSDAWMEDRGKVRALIEAHLAAIGEAKTRLHDRRLRPSDARAERQNASDNCETPGQHLPVKSVG